ncbi:MULTISPECIES: transketolase [unclassified Arcicella]|uniref:transketolase n=1 Tax=unclassified Arcicella TaxID=2644986 RepID=UPI0028667EA3|nr:MULTISPECIES: transketolase [unclassified Arcicella]MDR6562197.1 transketolase [Arcicella sp. BE51]MDR6812109.1 transketolase [Arcicella sp. BE140]MDR6823420.1 transketolase [Arcicella sp. BE139]
MELKQLQNTASQVRRDIVRMVHACQSGHPGGSLGCTDLVVALYFHEMTINEEKGADGYLKFSRAGQNEDLFFLSNGHISPLFYSVLAHRGYFAPAELATFRKINSRLQGHPATHEHLPGIRIASGSLGQGLSVAAGAAKAKRLRGDDRNIYVLMGDGEQQEGQVWEAAQFAAHYQLDNLIAIIDWNKQQIDGPTEKVMSNKDLKAKYEAFGWATITLENGNDMQLTLDALAQAKQLKGQGKPIMILMKSEMGYGVDYMMGTHKWHGAAPNDEQLNTALLQLEETIGDY